MGKMPTISELSALVRSLDELQAHPGYRLVAELAHLDLARLTNDLADPGRNPELVDRFIEADAHGRELIRERLRGQREGIAMMLAKPKAARDQHYTDLAVLKQQAEDQAEAQNDGP